MRLSSEEKDRYRRSKEWKEKRQAVIKEANYTCFICGQKKPSRHLNVHHYDEDTYTEEKEGDLVLLCQSCHSTLLERRLLRIKRLDIDRFCANLKTVYARSKK